MKQEILFGYCLDLMKDIPDASIDMILADLPYGTTRCEWDSVIPLDKLWLQYNRIIKEHGAIVLTAQTPFDKILGCSNLSMLRYEWVWEKTQATGHLNAKRMPMKAHENVLVFYKKLPTFNPQKTFGHKRKISTATHKRNSNTGLIYGKCDNFSDYDSTERYPRSVQVFASDKQKMNLHSNQKPIALFTYFIKTYTNEGDVVLDNVGGSGTTAISCLENNRQFIIMENNKKYFETILSRVNLHKKAIGNHDKACIHKNAYHFHENAPAYCPDCDQYLYYGIATV